MALPMAQKFFPHHENEFSPDLVNFNQTQDAESRRLIVNLEVGSFDPIIVSEN